jgi:hypothetical protein
VADNSSITQAQAFALHSRPSATKKIYLDFDGAVTKGTAWNAAYSLTTITTPAFDLDGSPTTWSAAELRAIMAVWRAVSEDFGVFDVDVTTENPALTVGTAASNVVTAVIGGNTGSCECWFGFSGLAASQGWHCAQPRARGADTLADC